MPYIPDPAHIATDLILSQLLDEIRKIYEQAAMEAQEKAAEYLGWFEEADQIARERWKDGEITEQEYKNWRTSHLLTSNRFRDLAEQLAQDMANADMIAASIINGHLPDVYALNHNYATYEVEHQSLVDTSYTLYDRQTVERLLRENPDLVPWQSVVKYPEVERWNEQLVSSIAAQSILQGEDVPTLARRISETLPTRNQNAAMRDARTIVTSAENGGRIDAYNRAEGMGIKLKKQWMATLDGRTRHSHRKLDQEKRDTNEPFSNGCMFPGDPNGAPAEVYNCRCCLVTQIEGFEWQQAETSPKLGDMSYEEWKGVHRDSGSDAIKNDNGATEHHGVHKIGKIDIDKYKCVTKDIVTDEVIITDERIQHIKERHPNDYERYFNYMKEIVEKPEYIVETNKPNTALILKSFEEGGKPFKTVLRLITSSDNPDYKNSIITFMKINEKEWNRLINNKKILYKSK